MIILPRLFLLMLGISTEAFAYVSNKNDHSEHSIVQRHTGFQNGRSVPCGASMALSSGNTVILQSPGYPYRYCNNCKCQWSFGSRNANDRLRLTCHDFQLEYSRDCTADSLGVETSSGYTQRFCGYSGPLNLESSGRISIKFTSNWYSSFKGFSCSVTVYATSGTLGTTSRPITQATPDPSPPTSVPQCKCGQQQGRKKKRSSEMPKWITATKEKEEDRGRAMHSFFPNSQLHNGMHPLRNRNSNHGVRVVGGTDAVLHEFPWVVLITYEGREASTCGGAIINNKYIITAAHCLLKPSPPFSQLEPSDIVISLADHDISTDFETTETIVTKPKRIIVHPDFGSATLFNDIGLIELSEPLNLESTSNIAPVCPPDPNDLYENREAVIVGWGFTKSPLMPPPSNADILQKAVLKIYSNSECQAKYTDATEKVTASMLCALGSRDEDACVNDSGGPLVVKEGGSWVVVGLVSWGPSDGSCGGNGGKPGVYTRVGDFLPWISSNMNGANTCPPIATPRTGNSARNSFGIFT